MNDTRTAGTPVTIPELADPSDVPAWADLYIEPPAPRKTSFAPGAQLASPRAEWGATLVKIFRLLHHKQ